MQDFCHRFCVVSLKSYGKTFPGRPLQPPQNADATPGGPRGSSTFRTHRWFHKEIFGSYEGAGGSVGFRVGVRFFC